MTLKINYCCGTTEPMHLRSSFDLMDTPLSYLTSAYKYNRHIHFSCRRLDSPLSLCKDASLLLVCVVVDGDRDINPCTFPPRHPMATIA